MPKRVKLQTEFMSHQYDERLDVQKEKTNVAYGFFSGKKGASNSKKTALSPSHRHRPPAVE
jgi:hypothetical protein